MKSKTLAKLVEALGLVGCVDTENERMSLLKTTFLDVI